MQALAQNCADGNLDDVKRLVEHGADPRYVFMSASWAIWGYVVNVTPIICAISTGDHVYVVKYLVQECGLDDKEKTDAMLLAIQVRRLRCVAFLACHGTVLPHGPFPTATTSDMVWSVRVSPMAALCCFFGATASDIAGILQEHKWAWMELWLAFSAAATSGKWEIVTCLLKAGTRPLPVLDKALDNPTCPPDLRKMLWAYKISSEQATMVQLACVSHKLFSKCLGEFEDKVALLDDPVTDDMRLQVATTITPDPLWQSLLVKSQLVVTAKSRLMSFVLHEGEHGLPDSLVRHVTGFLGVPAKACLATFTLTGKMLARRGALVHLMVD